MAWRRRGREITSGTERAGNTRGHETHAVRRRSIWLLSTLDALLVAAGQGTFCQVVWRYANLYSMCGAGENFRKRRNKNCPKPTVGSSRTAGTCTSTTGYQLSASRRGISGAPDAFAPCCASHPPSSIQSPHFAPVNQKKEKNLARRRELATKQAEPHLSSTLRHASSVEESPPVECSDHSAAALRVVPSDLSSDLGATDAIAATACAWWWYDGKPQSHGTPKMPPRAPPYHHPPRPHSSPGIVPSPPLLLLPLRGSQWRGSIR